MRGQNNNAPLYINGLSEFNKGSWHYHLMCLSVFNCVTNSWPFIYFKTWSFFKLNTNTVALGQTPPQQLQVWPLTRERVEVKW